MSLEEWITKEKLGKYSARYFKKWLVAHNHNLQMILSEMEWQGLWEQFVSDSLVITN